MNTMKFKYKKFETHILRPVIPIEIVFQGRSIHYEVLIDSGADLCLFDAEIGEVLGIEIERGPRYEIGGITGVIEYYHVHPITLKVGGWNYPVEVGFMPKMPSFGHGLVGQRGFFDLFIVKFDLIKEEIELQRR